MEEIDVVVIGAGPTGLGAASRLNQLNHKSWILVDAAPEAGGLSCTDVTKEGFLFDMGGHVIFSHFRYFDELLDSAVGKGDDFWAVHERVSYIWIRDRWVPYPFQNNISAVPLDDQVKCINGLIDAKVAMTQNSGKPVVNFDEWIIREMGEGIANLFMRPYNFKVWAIPPHLMQATWLGERVATINVNKCVENVLRNKTESSWGPNSVFRFPLQGGTGGIWKGVANKCCGDLSHQRYNCRVERVDAANKIVEFSDGKKLKYNKLLSTLPLDHMLTWCGKSDLGSRLTYSSTHIIGIGLRGVSPHDNKCWLYYPEDNCPFYRCTVFSHYAPGNIPTSDVLLPTLRTGGDATKRNDDKRPGPYWSLMFEVSESRAHKPVNLATVIEETIQGAINTKMISSTDEIVSIYHRRLEYGYPTPCLNRTGVLNEALPYLKSLNIWSRGRFGAWKYEVGNQDHSCFMGVEAVDNMLFGTKEFTLFHPSLTNEGGSKNMEVTFELK